MTNEIREMHPALQKLINATAPIDADLAATLRQMHDDGWYEEENDLDNFLCEGKLIFIDETFPSRILISCCFWDEAENAGYATWNEWNDLHSALLNLEASND